MKKLDIIYEVSIMGYIKGREYRDSMFYKSQTKAMDYMRGVIEGTKEDYENNYKVEYSFEEKKIDSPVTDIIYMAEFVDTTNYIHYYSHTITITKRCLI